MAEHSHRPPRPEDSEIARTVAHLPDEDLDPRVGEILDDYFEKLQTGDAPDIDSILAAHPDLADELQACFDGLQLVQNVATDTNDQAANLRQLGDFRMLREVGRGGMGVVYEAEQISLKRRVALKVLRYMVADKEAMERFQREAETIASLHHSNIVPIFAVGQAEGINYFAMQFIDGESLADVQKKAEQDQTPFDPMDVADWGRQAAEALAYAHENGIIHRDVKPSNLIRDEQGRVWLTDFGLAKRLDDVQLSMTGAILGTPRYMSPEQASSVRMPVDHRTDIYSLGATLYELATGKPLFDAETTHKALGRILVDEPVPPRTIRPGLPRDLETIIMRCLSKDATQRYESASELAEDLRAYMDGRPINARRPSLVEQLGRWLQKNQKLVTTAATAAAIAIAVLLGTRLAISEYRESITGRLQFETTRDLSNPVVATIVNNEQKQVVPSFTIPTQQPIPIPKGDYELRLQSDGELTDRYRLSVYPNDTLNAAPVVQTHLTDRNVWEPIEVSGEWDLWHHSDGARIVVFDDDGVTLLDGATSKQIWRVDLSEIDSMPSDTQNNSWQWRPQNTERNGIYAQPAKVANRTGEVIDCDDDGEADLILTCQHHPMVLALSGKDGSLLWFDFVKPKQYQHYRQSSILGPPLFSDLDGDDVADLINCYAVHDGSGATSTECRLRAVSGTDGKLLWEHPIDPKLHANPRGVPFPPYMSRWYPTESFNMFHPDTPSVGNVGVAGVDSNTESHVDHEGVLAPFPLQFVPGTDKKRILLCVADTLLRLNSDTGDVIAQAKLPDIPVRSPQWVDADADGTYELLVCTRNLPKNRNTSGIPVSENPALHLELWDVANAKSIWAQDIVANWEWQLSISAIASECREWPLIEDLDGDGQNEIVLPAASTAGKSVYEATPMGRMQILDLTTGNTKWTSQPLVSIDGQLNHFLVVEDLNNDGVRDIATASIYLGPDPSASKRYEKPFRVFVDILSGQDGANLSRIKSPPFMTRLNKVPDILQLTSLDGQLAVELRRRRSYSEETERTLIFDPASGECESVVDTAKRPSIADCGGATLVCWTPKNAIETYQGGTLRAFRLNQSRSGKSWKYAHQHFQVIGDVDGDGIDDAAGSPFQDKTVNMVSGSTGRYLWSTEGTGGLMHPLKSDLDGDGAFDFVLERQAMNQALTTESPLIAISGRTGKQLWQMWLDKKVNWSKPKIYTEDIDGDGKDEVLAIVQTDYTSSVPPTFPSGNPICMFCLDGATGKMQWTVEVEDGQQRISRYSNDFHYTVADMDGSGTLDIIGYGVKETKLRLKAWDGRDGSVLWDQGKTAIDTDSNKWRDFPFLVNAATQKRRLIVSAGVADLPQRTPDSFREQVVVKAIDGASGEDVWTWKKPTAHSGGLNSRSDDWRRYGVPTALHVRTPHGEQIGIWHTTRESVEFSLLRTHDEDAGLDRVAHTFPIHDWGERRKFDYGYLYDLRVWSVDVDGDDFDELVYVAPNKQLVAYSPAKEQELWRVTWAVKARTTRVEALPDGRAEIRGWFNDDDGKLDQVVALDGNGQIAWTDTTPKEWRQQPNRNPHELLRSTRNRLPKFLYRAGEGQRGASICHVVTPEKDHLRSEKQMATATALPTASTEPDMRHLRQLRVYVPSSGKITKSLMLSMMILIIPLAYFRRLMRGRWSLQMLMLAPLVTAILIAGLRWPHPNLYAGHRLEVWNFQQALAWTAGIVPPCVFVWFAAKAIYERRWRSLLFLVLVAISLSLFPAVSSLAATGYFSSPIRIRYDWRSLFMFLIMGMQACGVLLILNMMIQRAAAKTVRGVERLQGAQS